MMDSREVSFTDTDPSLPIWKLHSFRMNTNPCGLKVHSRLRRDMTKAVLTAFFHFSTGLQVASGSRVPPVEVIMVDMC